MSKVKDDGLLLIERLRCFSSTEFDQKFDDILVPVLGSIRSCDITHLEELLKVLAEQCFSSIRFENLENRFFEPAFFQLRQIIISLYDDAASYESEQYFDSDAANNSLSRCAGLLKFISKVLGYIIQDKMINYKLIKSMPINSALILSSTYKHCKASESIYGGNIQKVYKALSNLFSISQQLQAQLITLISANIQYDFDIDEDLRHFIEVFKILVICGEELIPLDIRSTASQWKAISQLAETYKEAFLKYIITEQIYFVDKPIIFLCNEINKSLVNMLEVKITDSSQVGKVIKLNNFFMKIVIKLCDLYKGYINDCVCSILTMLYNIFSLCPSLLQFRGIANDDICNSLQTHIHVGAQILIGHLIQDQNFIRYFLNRDLLIDNLSYLLLSTSVLKKIIPGATSVRGLWMSSKSLNLIDSIFEIISKSHYELSLPVKYPGIALEGQAPVEVGLYELLLIYIGGFILSANALEFELIENTIFLIFMDYDQMKTSAIWPTIMASDLICLIDRYGTSDLCYKHVSLFAEILNATSCFNQIYCIELVFMKQTLSRLFCLLPKQHKAKFLEEYGMMQYVSTYTAIGLNNIECIEKPQVFDIIKNCEVIVDDFFKSGGVAKFEEMTDTLLMLSTSNFIQDFECTSLISKLIDLWHCTKETDQITNRLSWENNLQSSNKFLTKFIIILMHVSSKFFLQIANEQLLMIFERMNELLTQSNISIKIQMCDFLKNLGTKDLKNDEYILDCLGHITYFFRVLLMDSNSIVEQRALEVFANFSHLTVHEEVIADVVGTDHKIQNKLKEFLMSHPCNMKDCISLDEYLKQQILYKSTCSEELSLSGKSVNLIEDDICEIFHDDFDAETPAKIKKIEPNYEIYEMFDDIQNKIDSLIMKNSAHTIDDCVKTKVKMIVDKLNSLL